MRIRKLNKQNQKIVKGRSVINYKRCIITGATGILAISSIFMTVVAATSSVEVASLREKEKILFQEKRNMENIIAESLSINDLEAKSSEMGYKEPANLVYIPETETVAANLP